tara:strand:- start:1846 stop:4209 length:2364 start_codon:yes stop_codon:yes gene_type:complete
MRILVILSFLASILNAQQFTISGYLSSKESGEKLIGASVFDEQSKLGTVSNTYGFFSLTIPKGRVNLRFSYVGYESKLFVFENAKDTAINIEMEEALNLKEVEISAERIERIEQESQMSIVNMPVEQIKALPALLGEVDVLKAVQMLPGVQSGTEGGSGIYVRGGGPDQNLILLDGTPVYNVSHLFGFFSVFNADAINNIKLIKGGFPARYGGRLSSVMEINMKEGNMKKIRGEGSIGAIASKLTLEGPIIKDKSSFIVSARRTYIDILAQPLIRAASSGGEDVSTGYYFYDLNAKLNYKFSDRDRIYLSAYMGDDKFYYKMRPYSYLYDGVLYEEKNDAHLAWGNITSAFRWNHQFSNKLFSNLTATYSHYDFNVRNYQETIQTSDTGVLRNIMGVEYLSGIDDWAVKLDFDYLPSPNHYVKFGAHYTYHTFKPGATSYQLEVTGVTNIDSTSGADNVHAHEMALYVEDDWKLSDRFKANIGLHLSGFQVENTFYAMPQPRISLRYLMWGDWALKGSYANMQQYIHLLTNGGVGLPTDLWVPVTQNIKPQKSDQIALGIAKTLNNRYLFSIEGYYKWMDGLIEYKDGASFLGSETKWYDKVESGKGTSYGVEIFVHKKTGRTQGWVGYTLSFTDRHFDNLNFGKSFPYKYDRRHDLSFVFTQKIDSLWDFSMTWVYGTGNALTLPIERYLGLPNNDGYGYIYPTEIEHYDEKNSFRMASYHRLDVGFKNAKKTKWGERTWSFGVYNAYNRQNPFYYYFGYDRNNNRALKRVSLFPFLPSVSWGFKF